MLLALIILLAGKSQRVGFWPDLEFDDHLISIKSSRITKKSIAFLQHLTITARYA